MTKFAAYDDHSIYAVGDTEAEALAEAVSAAGGDTTGDNFEVAPIEAALAAWIEENGFNGNCDAFDIDENGQIVASK